MNTTAITYDLPDFSLIEPHHSHTVVFYQSRCHRYQGGFTPEEGSAQWERDQVLSKRKDCLGSKLHWVGARCVMVIGPHAWKHRDRNLTGDAFNALPKEERCKMCDFQFMSA